MSTLYNTLMAWLSGAITARVRQVSGLSLWLERGVGAAFIALGARLAFIKQPL
jgi:threonine/homoserine/homoserine lactone efflux protein